MKRKNTFRLFSLVLTFALVFTNFMGIQEAKADDSSQEVVIDEGFDNGTTPPQGWDYNGIDSIYTDIYETKTPALKFDKTGDCVTTQRLVNPSKITFWIQGQGTDDNSYLKVEEYDDGHWTLIQNVKPIPKAGTQYSHSLDSDVTKVKFTYHKVQGDLAFDDVTVVADDVPVDRLVLNNTDRTITIGNTTTLTATVYPDYATNKDLIWETDNKEVATVVNGLVKGLSEGDAEITVTSEDNQEVTGTYNIHVTSTDGITEIKNLRVDTDNDGKPDSYDPTEILKIEGRISADFRKSTVNKMNKTIYVQDTTGGICVVGATKDLALGKTVIITGTVNYDGPEVKFLTDDTNIDITDNDIDPVDPTELSIKNSMLEAYEGMLVNIQGTVTKINGLEVFVSDGADESSIARVTGVTNYSAVVNSLATKLAVKVGDTLNITGIAAEDADGHKIMVRSIDDVKFVIPTPSIPDQPKNPATSVRLNKSSIVIKAGKFTYVNILTVPGNAVVKILKFKCADSSESCIVKLTQDKKNTRLLKLATDAATSSQPTKTYYLVVTVNNKEYKLPIYIKIDGAKVQPKKPAAKPSTTKVKK